MSNTPATHQDRLRDDRLDLDRDGLCEIAVIVTDFDLIPLHPISELVINPGAEALEQMNSFVRGMHGSQLLPRIEAGVSVEEAERQVIDYLAQHVTAGRRLHRG